METKMDKKSRLAFKALGEAHDRLSVPVAALVAILGAITESRKPDPDRVDAWCEAISVHSDPEHGVPEAEVRRFAHDLLLGIDATKLN